MIDTGVETMVDDYTHDGRDEASVGANNTARLEDLAVDIRKTVNLVFSSTLLRLGVVRGAKGKGETPTHQSISERRRRNPKIRWFLRSLLVTSWFSCTHGGALRPCPLCGPLM